MAVFKDALQTVKSGSTEKPRRQGIMMEGHCSGFCSATRNPMKENRVVLELLLPKPGGHVLSPDFGQIKRWAVMEMGLEDMRMKNF